MLTFLNVVHFRRILIELNFVNFLVTFKVFIDALLVLHVMFQRNTSTLKGE